jgi:hypothetical protein
MSSSDASAVAGGHLARPATRSPWYSRRRLALILVGGLLLAYYMTAIAVHGGEAKHEIDVKTIGDGPPRDQIALSVEVQDLLPSERQMSLTVQPEPKGDFARVNGSELSEPVRMLVSSPGRPPVEFDIPARQAIDPVTVPLTLSSGAYGYPFDRPDARARFSMITTEGDRAVPVSVQLTSVANDWRVSGTATRMDDSVRLDVEAKRDVLVTSLAIFYLLAIGLTAIISVAVIGASLTDGEVSFSEVIWLGAMLVAIPAMRNEMPGAPSIGTAIDVFVFFPAVGIVALTLLAATVVLAASKRAGRAGAEDDDE